MFLASPGVVSPFPVPVPRPGYGQKRMHVTSLTSITSSSPSNKKCSRPPRKFFVFDRILLRKRHNPKRIGDSKSARIQLRLSIIEKRQSTEVRDIYCSSSDKDDCVIIHNMKKTAAFHLSAGLCKEALHTLSGCLALQQKMNGKESVEVAETLNMMGTVMAILGTEYHYRAVAAFEQALEIYQQQLGIGSEESAACRKNLCMLLNQRLNYDVRCKHLSIRSVSMFQNWAFVKDQYQYGTIY